MKRQAASKKMDCRIDIRVPSDLRKRLDKMAAQERRTVANMIRLCLEYAARKHEAGKKI